MLKLDPSLWRRAQSVFDQVVDLPRAERDAALLLACDGDGDLRAMVDNLLAADDRALPEPQPAAVALGHLVDPEMLPGSRIGSFEVEKLIGAGGMGRVYLAHRSDGRVEQSVAIKTIRGAYGGRDLLKRFARERRILAKFNHPNIARFIDAGECADGSPYVAMEFVSGTPLLEYVRENQLSLRERLDLFVKIASAVDHAHRQLVVHRDLKPGNVMVDAQGEPKLLDFGIAKPVQQHQEQNQLEGGTAPDARYYSLMHAAPEQIDGDADSVSVDIYALGGLLYELITGRFPLDLQGLSFHEARARIQNQMPAPPSTVLEAGLPYARRELSGDLDRIVLHALRKEPERRYASAAALIDDLQRLLDHRPISLRASHRWYLVARFLRRHRLASVMLALLLSVVVGAAGLFRYQRDEAIRESARAEMVSSIMVDAFRAADPSRNGGEKLTARDVMRQARQAVSRRQDLDPSTRAKLLLSLSEVHSSLGLDDEAGQLAQQVLTLSAGLAQALAAEFRIAQSEFALGHALESKARTQRLLQLTESDPHWHTRVQLLQLDIEGQLNQIDVLALARDIYQQAQQRLLPGDKLLEAALLNYAKKLIGVSSTMAQGAELIREQLKIVNGGSESPEQLEMLRLAARIERRFNNPQAALGYSKRSLVLAEKLYGKQHPAFVQAESGYALSLLQAGMLDQARSLFATAIEHAGQVHGQESANVAVLAHNAGVAAMDEPVDLPLALRMSAMAVDIGPRTMPADSRQMGFFWNSRATALLLDANSDPASALSAAEAASTIFLVSYDISEAVYAEAELLAAVAEARLGRAAKASERVIKLGSDRDFIPPETLALRLAREQKLIGDKK